MKKEIRTVHIDEIAYKWKRFSCDGSRVTVFEPGTKKPWITVQGYKPSEVKAAIVEHLKSKDQ